MTTASARLRRLLGRPPRRPLTHLYRHLQLSTQLDTAPRRTATWAAVIAAFLTGAAFGPVAAAIAACYTAMALLGFARHRTEAAARRRRTAARHAISALAADLRAGADITTALSEARALLSQDDSAPPSPMPGRSTDTRASNTSADTNVRLGRAGFGPPMSARSAATEQPSSAQTRQDHHAHAGTAGTTRSVPPATARSARTAPPLDPACRRIRARLDAAVHIAETTGAPIAELLDRLAADLRAGARVEASLSTHTAGSQASSRLLAALPMAGLALGQTLGTDPITILLHTPLGAGCAMTALALQLAGLAWSRRILATAGALA